MRAVLALAIISAAAAPARAQSPELALRELASGQIKKGVRAIGFGGDGATSGNYALVYRDAGTALVDYGITEFDNGNEFTFTAVGVTTPRLWHGLVVYAIALSQHAEGIGLDLTSPGLGNSVAVRGGGANEAAFVKIAMPLSHHVSVGLLLSYEQSSFDATTLDGGSWIHYETRWLPSGGFGATWEPDPRWLVGARVILDHDDEIREDPGRAEGLARSYEYRLGASYAAWPGGVVDVGATALQRSYAVSGVDSTVLNPNLGLEQVVIGDRALVARAGYDESTIGTGLSIKLAPVNVDIAYLYDLGSARIGALFGAHSHSLLVTMTLDYARMVRRASGT